MGTTRFAAGVQATVNSFECREEDMCFRLEVAAEDGEQDGDGSGGDGDGGGVEFLQGGVVGMGLGMRYGC